MTLFNPDIQFANDTIVKVNEEQGSTRICIRRASATLTNALTVLLDYTSILATGKTEAFLLLFIFSFQSSHSRFQRRPITDHISSWSKNKMF